MMGKHRILQNQASANVPSLVADHRVDAGQEAALIADYLDHFCAPLVGTVPYARRQELRRELTCHLESLIEALEELGATREEAVLDALQRFGNPRMLGAQWAHEWSQGTPEPLTPWAPMKVTTAAYGALSLLVVALISSGPQPGAWAELLALSLATVAPAAVGLLTGLKVRGRSALGTIYGIFPLAVVCGLLFFIAGRLNAAPDESRWESVVGSMIAFQVIAWLPIGTAAAALGQWLRRRVVWLPPRLALK